MKGSKWNYQVNRFKTMTPHPFFPETFLYITELWNSLSRGTLEDRSTDKLGLKQIYGG